MKQIKFLGAAIVALLALACTLSATASAEMAPNVLPLGTEANPLTGTSSSATSTFGNGLLKVESKKSEGTFSGTSEKLGTFDALILESKDTLGRTCTGLNDTTAGSILALGTFHIRAYKNAANELKTAVLFLLSPEVHFECGTLLIIWKGCLAGALTPESVLSTSLTATLAKNGSLNDNIIVKVENEALTGEENCELLSKTDEGSFELATLVTTQTLTGFKQSGSAVTVLVMPD
jgi:hypothetical protein